MGSVYRGVKNLLGTIQLDAVHHNPACSVSPNNTCFQTSYDLGLDCITVPASPPLWTPPSHGLPIVLPRDTPSPSHPQPSQPPTVLPAWTLDPMFRAMDYARPQLELKEFDLITDRKNIRALLEFVQNGCGPAGHRIDAELVGNKTVVFFVGWRGGRGYNSAGGYGINFERAFTGALSEGIIQHNRVVTYTLGPAESPTLTIPAPVRPSNVGPTGFRIIPSGATLAAPESILEIKTVRTGRSSHMRQTLTQMWFSRTPTLVTGCHDGAGTFTAVKMRNVLEDGALDDWEVKHMEHLQKMLKLVEMIKEHLTASPIKRQAVVLKKNPNKLGQPVMEFYSLVDSYEYALPSDLRQKWFK